MKRLASHIRRDPQCAFGREMERYIRSKYQDRMWINKKLLDGDDEDDEEEDEEESSEEEPVIKPLAFST